MMHYHRARSARGGGIPSTLRSEAAMLGPSPQPLPGLTPARTPHPLHKMERDERKERQPCREGVSEEERSRSEAAGTEQNIRERRASTDKTSRRMSDDFSGAPSLKGRDWGLGRMANFPTSHSRGFMPLHHRRAECCACRPSGSHPSVTLHARSHRMKRADVPFDSLRLHWRCASAAARSHRKK